MRQYRSESYGELRGQTSTLGSEYNQHTMDRKRTDDYTLPIYHQRTHQNKSHKKTSRQERSEGNRRYHHGTESEQQEEMYQKVKRRKDQSAVSAGGGRLSSNKAAMQRPMQQLPATAIVQENNQEIR